MAPSKTPRVEALTGVEQDELPQTDEVDDEALIKSLRAQLALAKRDSQPKEEWVKTRRVLYQPCDTCIKGKKTCQADPSNDLRCLVCSGQHKQCSLTRQYYGEYVAHRLDISVEMALKLFDKHGHVAPKKRKANGTTQERSTDRAKSTSTTGPTDEASTVPASKQGPIDLIIQTTVSHTPGSPAPSSAARLDSPLAQIVQTTPSNCNPTSLDAPPSADADPSTDDEHTISPTGSAACDGPPSSAEMNIPGTHDIREENSHSRLQNLALRWQVRQLREELKKVKEEKEQLKAEYDRVSARNQWHEAFCRSLTERDSAPLPRF